MNHHGMRPPHGRPPMGEARHSRSGKQRTLAEISITVWLNKNNASFFFKNGLLYIKQNEKELRVTLCRAFPFELQWEYISVLGEDEAELGLIRNVEADFDGESRENLITELKRRYYAPVIEQILRVKERYGFSFWKVKTAEGEVNFTLRDTYRSILRASDERVMLLDVDGNRFEIPNVRALDKKSYKKIELYL